MAFPCSGGVSVIVCQGADLLAIPAKGLDSLALGNAALGCGGKGVPDCLGTSRPDARLRSSNLASIRQQSDAGYASAIAVPSRSSFSMWRRDGRGHLVMFSP